MRELINVTSNTAMFKNDDGSWDGRAEIVIITSEPQYRFDEDLDLKVRRRECEQFRFMADEKQIGALIEGLEHVRFELQNAQTAINNANTEKKAA